MTTPAGLPPEALSDSKVVLVLCEPGSSLSLTGERLVVRMKGELAQMVPVNRVEQVIVQTRAASLSVAAVRACIAQGIPVALLEPTGVPYALISSAHLVGTVLTRRSQLRAYDQPSGGALMVAMASGKLANQATLLKYVGKYRRNSDIRTYEVLADAVSRIEALRRALDGLGPGAPDELRPQLLSIEGRAGLLYWDAIALVLPENAGFPGREHKGAADSVNACLNYGYGILQSQVWAALVFAGLDPFGGYIHVDRPGRPALVLDCMEEFRPAVVDRAIIAMFNTGQRVSLQEGFLDHDSRRLVARRILERLEARERVGRKHYTLRTILQLQARAVASHVRGERAYRPFTSRW